MKKYTIKSILEAIFIISLGSIFVLLSIVSLYWDFEYKSSWEITTWTVTWYESEKTTTKRQWTFTTYSPILEWTCKWIRFKKSFNENKSNAGEIQNWKIYNVYCINKSNWTFLEDIDSVNDHKFSIFFFLLGSILIWLGWIFRKSDVK